MTPLEAAGTVRWLIYNTDWKADCPEEVCLMIEAKAKLIEFLSKIGQLKVSNPVPVGDEEDE